MESLGEFLKNHRRRQNITLDEIAEETRIRKTVLDAIENSRYNLLPPRAFIRGFLKTYAAYLKIDEDEVIRRFQEEMERQEVTEEGGGNAGKGRIVFLSPLRILVFFAVFILTLVFWFLLSPQGRKKSVQDNGYGETAPKSIETHVVIEQEPAEEKGEEKVVQEVKKPAATGVSESSNEVVEEAQEIVAEKMVLRVVAAEKAWIKFQLDYDDPFEVLLKSGESLTVKADEKFNLKVGNAGGVELFLNEQSLGNPGKIGEVIDLTLPE